VDSPPVLDRFVLARDLLRIEKAKHGSDRDRLLAARFVIQKARHRKKVPSELAVKKYEPDAQRWAEGVLRRLRQVLDPKLNGIVRRAAKRTTKARDEDMLKWVTEQLFVGGVARTVKPSLEAYIELAGRISVPAGSSALRAMGLGRAFEWAAMQDQVFDLFGLHGSKIIQGIYGQHMDRLAEIITDAIAPQDWATMGKLTSAIRDEWDDLTRSQAERIARTETANIWESTQAFTYSNNGIQRKEWLPASTTVDDLCLENAAEGAIGIDDEFPSGDTEPPAHPNCVCDIAPVTVNEDGSYWLPPDEPWTGGID
jgi:SPP1 gp7 family putative phage head morphogenesis protein